LWDLRRPVNGPEVGLHLEVGNNCPNTTSFPYRIAQWVLDGDFTGPSLGILQGFVYFVILFEGEYEESALGWNTASGKNCDVTVAIQHTMPRFHIRRPWPCK
jgi:hypothetical protein